MAESSTTAGGCLTSSQRLSWETLELDLVTAGAGVVQDPGEIDAVCKELLTLWTTVATGTADPVRAINGSVGNEGEEAGKTSELASSCCRPRLSTDLRGESC